MLYGGPPTSHPILVRAIYHVVIHHKVAKQKRQADFEELEQRLLFALPDGFNRTARDIVEDILREGTTYYAELPELALTLGGVLLLAQDTNPVAAWREVRQRIVLPVEPDDRVRRDARDEDDLREEIRTELAQQDQSAPRPRSRR